jgi:hypothetical protein
VPSSSAIRSRGSSREAAFFGMNLPSLEADGTEPS